MPSRRDFLKTSMLTAGALAVPRLASAVSAPSREALPAAAGARVISTWDFGVPANQAAWAVLAAGGKALDAVEKGAQVPESDLSNHSVGKGGYPDRDGKVTLDASIMDGDGRCGAVACLERIAHPVRVARRVMEATPHVLLVGDGALQFAREQGFHEENLLTPEAEKAWREWLKTAKYQPVANSENLDYRRSLPGGRGNHDTIGMPSTRTAISRGPAPPAAWRGSCTAASATARSSARACTWTAKWAAPPPPASARK